MSFLMEDEERVEYWIEMATNLEALFIARASDRRRSGQCVVAMSFPLALEFYQGFQSFR